MIHRARLKYIQQHKPRIDVVSLEDIPEALLTTDLTVMNEQVKGGFKFEEERIDEAFSALPLRQQAILAMLFVEKMKPFEIAEILGCPERYVYNQRYQALKSLRSALMKGDDKT